MAPFAFRSTIVPQLACIFCWIWTTTVATAWQPTTMQDVESANTAATDDEQQQHRLWIDYYKRAAARYEFELASRDNPTLKLTSEPVHKYTHPSGLQGTHGAFFVWTQQGRPQVVGSIWSYEIGGGKRSVAHEFHSLALKPLKPVRVGEHIWQPRSGIVREPLENAGRPGRNAKLRLIKMRSLAREFTGFTKLSDKEVKLRLLQRPLFRFASTSPKVIDGALFGLFNEWDPEIMLLIEAVEGPDGPLWCFAAARFNICPLRLERAGKDAWHVDRGPQAGARFGNPNGAFFAVHAVDMRDLAGKR